MRPRGVALIAVLALSVGWLAREVAAPPSSQSAGAPIGRRALGVTTPPAPTAEQLRLKLVETQPPSPTPRRNLFTFGSRRAVAPSRPETAMEATPAPLPPPPPGPSFTLSGIATSEEAGQRAHTAILSGSGSLLFVKAGDSLPGGYSVVRVEEAAVVVVDAAGAERTLRLK